MKHARADYNLIQDPRGLIPRDEPVFLLRGQDFKAQACMKLWCDLAHKEGVEPAMIEMVRSQMAAMDEWQLKIKGKVSDMPSKADMQAGQNQQVKKGQVWEATDFRNSGMEVRVEHLQGMDAICLVTVNPGGRPSGTQARQTRIPLARFKEGAVMGFKLKTDV